MNTTENNKLIADFMDCENPEAWEDDLYLNDWNWLMQVVDRIRIFHNGTEPLNDKQIVSLLQLIKKLNKALTLRNNVSIEAVFNACVEFIKWYNQQKQ